MLLGALLDAGAPLDALRAALETLPVGGWSLEAEVVDRQGVRGTQAHVRLDPGTPQPRRGLRDVEAIIRGGGLPSPASDRACAVFRHLAQAEAAIHGGTPDEVHFHEVGAVDALVDVVGVVLALHLLGVAPAHTWASGLPLGSGWVQTDHGLLPVPAPATAELLRAAGAPTRPAPAPDATGELVTPTGAALVTRLARFAEPRFSRVEQVGYGFGSRTPPWPNAARVWLGDGAAALDAQDALAQDEVVEIETNLDDSTPEELGFAMERLLAGGALDVAFSPLVMKKNRPGVLVQVLAPPPLARPLAELLLAHTSALGVRLHHLQRYVAARSARTVHTPWGPVAIKEKRLPDRVVAAPEYEDCAALARQHGLPLSVVYEAARAAASAGQPSDRRAEA